MPVIDMTSIFDFLPSHYVAWLNSIELKSATELFIHIEDIPKIRHGGLGWSFFNEATTQADLDHIESKLPYSFDKKNRTGLPGQLHRIACVRNSQEKVIGYTIRIAKTIDNLDLLIKEELDSNANILIIAPPSRGKTSMLRNIACYLSNELVNVVIVDYSNEIAGGGDSPHESVGLSTRLQVPWNKEQFQVMREAIENHAPDVVIVDEVSTKDEAFACKTIAERGIRLIATAHGKNLEGLLKTTVKFMLGNVSAVTLSDGQAEKRELDRKTVLEREEAPSFDVAIEITAFGQVNVYKNVEKAVDAFLRGKECKPEVRRLEGDKVLILSLDSDASSKFAETTPNNMKRKGFQ